MVRRLNSLDADFGSAFDALVYGERGATGDVRAAVAAIIDAVRAGGMAALARYTQEFDGFDLTEESARVTEEDCEKAEAACDAEDLAALDLAADRIRAYHERQRPKDERFVDEAGLTLGWRWTPVAAAGLYVPGGRAAYPSSVLMNAIPAKIAGVPRLCLCTPAPARKGAENMEGPPSQPRGEINPLALVAARRAGVDEIWRVGGAQAIAAMAYGAGPIRPVDMIAGPGNAYVAEAKRQVFGDVGIDSVAGPSEILVVADADNDPDWIAADLLSQAEHDASSQAVLITDDAPLADNVAMSAEKMLRSNPRREIATAAWDHNSAIIVVETLDEAPALIDRIAPEHLELAVANPDALAAKVRSAGAIFLGRFAPEAIGDYIAGPNHVLPTGRAARYASGLSVLDFMKRSTIIGCDKAAIEKIGPAAARLADAEGLHAHAASVRARLKD